MVWPAIIGAAAAIGGVAMMNRANRRVAQRQMDFQASMSGTSYQRAMADMRKAGLNPILAYKQGGASTPGGAGIAQQDPIGAGISTALGVTRQKAELSLIKAQDDKTSVEGNTARVNYWIAQEELHSARAVGSLAKISKSFYDSEAGKAAVIAGMAMRNINPLLQLRKGGGR